MGFLRYDGPIMKFLNKMSDLVVLNLLTLVCCIPVITIGASITAANYAALKLCRGEGYVTKNFWKSLKENLIQSTMIWLMFLICIVAIAFGIHTVKGMNNSAEPIIVGILFTGIIVWSVLFVWVFPMQSRFANTIGRTFQNAFYIAMKHFLKTICMLGIYYLLVLVVMMLSIGWYSLLLLFGISIPVYLCAILYDKVFDELEEIVTNGEKKSR